LSGHVVRARLLKDLRVDGGVRDASDAHGGDDNSRSIACVVVASAPARHAPVGRLGRSSGAETSQLRRLKPGFSPVVTR
ncbi:MAG: hypothetical protein K2X43_25365, partial [Hyphomonadaceae bacterium]|nr:hypothetical protein [Hyphomonadaceae bacterium]